MMCTGLLFLPYIVENNSEKTVFHEAAFIDLLIYEKNWK